jgi:thioesterase domain-containing protein/acyl carrier protein
MIPAAFVFLEALPIGPGGKVNRQALPPPDPTDASLGKTFLAPRDRLESQLAQIWQSVMNVNPVSITDNFFELGGHSLNTVKLTAEIEKHLGVDLSITAILAAPSIEKLANVIRAGGWSPPRNCLIEIRPAGSNPPLFVMGAGQALSPYLDLDQPVYGLSFLAMFEKQVTLTTLKEIAASYIESIRSVQPKGPYYIAGHSSGGTVALEMAQMLDAQGEKIALLALLDTYGPRSRTLSFFQKFPAYWRALKRHKAEERLAYVCRICRFAKHRIQQMFWPMFCHSFLSGQPISLTTKNISIAYDIALLNYVPQSYRGSAVLLRSNEGSAGMHDDADRGWTGIFAGGLEIQDIPGDHETMLQEPHVRKVAACLSKCLHEAQRAMAK